MKQFMAQLSSFAMLALAACGGGEEEPTPMELGPDTARSEAVIAIDLAQSDIGGAAP